jgi:hypothetical protein
MEPAYQPDQQSNADSLPKKLLVLAIAGLALLNNKQLIFF